MKFLKASIVALGLTLCVAACNKTPKAEDNTMNAAAPEAAAPEANAAAENATTDNNAVENATNNGDKTDTGPRG